MPNGYISYQIESLISNIAFFVGIGLWILFAFHFAKVAAKKGHSFKWWLLVCLLIGPFGYAWVNSLADLVYEEIIDRLESRVEQLEALVRKNIQSGNIENTHAFRVAVESPQQDAADDEWICNFCDTKNKFIHGQCKKCGSYRSKQ